MTTIVISGRGVVAAACVTHLRNDSRVAEILEWPARRQSGSLDIASIDDLGALSNAVVILAGAEDDDARLDLALDAGVPCVSVADADANLRELFAREVIAHESNVPVIVGAGFAPGLADLLVAHGAEQFDRVDDIRIARVGVAGPECRRTLRRALREEPHEWRRGAWRRVTRRGAERMWFPPPIGARECEPVDIGAITLQKSWPEASIAVRAAGVSRAWSLTSKEHEGAIRVEVWGERNGRRESVVYGAVAPTAHASGVVAAVTAVGLTNDAGAVDRRPGVRSVGQIARPTRFLEEVTAAGVTVSVFEGVSG